MAWPRFAAPKIELPQVDRHFGVIGEGSIAYVLTGAAGTAIVVHCLIPTLLPVKSHPTCIQRVAEHLTCIAKGLDQHGRDGHVEPERSQVKLSVILCCHASTPLQVGTEEMLISVLLSIPLL